MGRKKFNMDPKKVGPAPNWLSESLTLLHNFINPLFFIPEISYWSISVLFSFF